MIVEVGIDYLCQSLNRGVKDYAEWYLKGIHIIKEEQLAGNELVEGSFRGYEGYYCGKVFIGNRVDGAFFRVIGGGADARFMPMFHREAHYSRLDVQVTSRSEPFDLEYIEVCELQANTANERLPDNRRREIALRRDNKHGRTLYIGVRTSPTYCRIYNKSAASTDEMYHDTWRYEVELHNDMATLVAARLSGQHQGIYEYICSLVWQIYRDRGIECPWTKQQGRAALPPQRKDQSDVDRKLKWLSEQVRPTIGYLQTVVDRDRILTALGLIEADAPELAP